MMELFDKKFVHFMWDDSLEGKRGFCADDICELTNCVHSGNRHLTKVIKSLSPAFPFKDTNNNDWLFFYYDPNYEVKKAFNEGKTIQYKALDTGRWCDFDPKLGPCLWNDTTKYRIKPEEGKKWIVYLYRRTLLDKNCYLTACREDVWEEAQEVSGAKTKLFVDTESGVTEWYRARQKFAPLIKAWEDGKQVQFLNCGQWEDCRGKPLWHLDNEYRIKPEEKKYCPCVSSVEMIDVNAFAWKIVREIGLAFLAGLNEGRLKWHKVVDRDVPDNVRYVWTNVGAGYYDNEDNCWRDAFSVLQGVVAWCEPKFEETKE